MWKLKLNHVVCTCKLGIVQHPNSTRNSIKFMLIMLIIQDINNKHVANKSFVSYLKQDTKAPWYIEFFSLWMIHKCHHLQQEHNLLVVGHVPHWPSEPRNLPTDVSGFRVRKNDTLLLRKDSTTIGTNIPISIRWIEIRRYIGPPASVPHVRIETPWTILLHTRDICPLRQNLKNVSRGHK